jgi:hypothetical protein
LDWRVEGSDFKLEMDIGTSLCDWLRASPEHDLILGSVADHTGGVARRPLMLIGLVHQSTRMACVPEVTNLPAGYKVSLFRINNPERVIARDRKMIILPTAHFESGKVPLQLLIPSDGVVRVPSDIAMTLTKTTIASFSIRVPDASLAECAADILITIGSTTTKASCTASNRNEMKCAIAIDMTQVKTQRRVSVALATAVKAPPLQHMSEALKKSAERLCRECAQSRKILIDGLAGRPIDEISFVRQ